MDLQPDGFYIRLQTLTVKGFGHLFTRETPYRHSSEFRIEAQSLRWKVLYWTKNNPTEGFFFFVAFLLLKCCVYVQCSQLHRQIRLDLPVSMRETFTD